MSHDNKGFTLIELLIVVVIIGILASIGITNFGNSKERAMVAAMKTDLRNLVSAGGSVLLQRPDVLRRRGAQRCDALRSDDECHHHAE